MIALKERLQKLDDPKSSEYIAGLREIIFDDNYTYTPDEYTNIIINDSNDILVRFSAFYCLFSDYRRFEKRYNLIELVDQYIASFSDKEQLNYYIYIILSQYYKIRFLVYSEKAEFDKAIENANKAINEYKCNRVQDIGCFNNYADIVLYSVREKGPIDSHCIDSAMKYVDTAIKIRENDRKLPPYANYYCSKALLYLYKGEFKSATDMIKLAIAYERTDRRDSMIRLSNYQNVQLEIKTKEIMNILENQVASIENEYETIHNQLNQQQIRYIEILGFFSAIIALIIGAISITLSANDFQISGALILEMTGGLIMGYTVLIELFSKHVIVIRLVVAISLSITMIIIGILLGRGII